MVMNLILASHSPRRCALLKDMGYDFTVAPSNIDESKIKEKNPEKLVVELAKLKAQYVAKNHSNSIILGADTIVYFNNKIIGKPKTISEAKKMLISFSERQQEVYTGYWLVNTKTNKEIGGFTKTTLLFNTINEKQIDDYFNFQNPLDKAGGYCLKEIIKRNFIKKVIGSIDNCCAFDPQTIENALNEIGYKK